MQIPTGLRRLRLAPILGFVADTGIASQLCAIGVMLPMFGVGTVCCADEEPRK